MTYGKDIFAALLVTLLGAALAWAILGGIPAIGIDDAAITRSYAENLARGAGYVYNIGGERVEGSTTLLWALMLTGAYALTPTPEWLILGLSGLLTFAALLAAFRVTRRLSARFSRLGAGASATGPETGPSTSAGTGDLAVGLLALALLASPGYFLWATWTMMEVALWSAALLWLVAHLVAWCESPGPPKGADLGLFLPALALPLIRPEGVAVAFGLVALGTLLAPARRPRGLLALALILAVFGAVTLFRVLHFGQPFPNTFYAKVSSDRIQDLVDGLKYAVSFFLGRPFAELYLTAWAAALIWALTHLKHPGARALLIPGAALLGILAIYAVLGGDHFALWRFYQPIVPLLPLALALGLALLVQPLSAALGGARRLLWPALAGAGAMLLVGWMHFYQARFDVEKEFTLVERGLGFGRYLNGVAPRPAIGVGPAGGIALAYEGQIYDLLGLNWTVMAHANPIKVGMRNHASFDKPTFWAHRPDVLATFNNRCTPDGTMGLRPTGPRDAFDGLFFEERFRSEFRPVLFRQGAACWPGFATPAWLAQVAEAEGLEAEGVEALAWSDVQVLN